MLLRMCVEEVTGQTLFACGCPRSNNDTWMKWRRRDRAKKKQRDVMRRTEKRFYKSALYY